MKTLIITGNDSSAGCLKAASRADATMGLWPRLLVGPPPDHATIMRIFGPQDTKFEDAFLDRRGPIMDRDSRRLPGSTEGLKTLCNNFDRVELWFDPDAESQLALTLLLSYLADEQQIIKNLTLVHPDVRLADMKPEDAAMLKPPSEPVRNDHLKLSARVWAAWQRPTPEEFASLLYEDTSALPAFGQNIVRLLDELPDGNSGLGASEVILLKLIAQGDAGAYRVLSRYHQELWPWTYTGFDAGQLLDDLCHAAEPAILGLPPGPYDMALMENEERWARYSSSPLKLSHFGQRLLEGDADFAEGQPRIQWWGGTRLTSERQWRWDGATRKLHSLM